MYNRICFFKKWYQCTKRIVNVHEMFMILLIHWLMNGKYLELNGYPHFLLLLSWRPWGWVLWQRLSTLHSVFEGLTFFFPDWDFVGNCTTNILLFCPGIQGQVLEGSRGQKIINWRSQRFVYAKFVQYSFIWLAAFLYYPCHYNQNFYNLGMSGVKVQLFIKYIVSEHSDSLKKKCHFSWI